MSEDRMPQEEAAEIARERKVCQERLHQLIFSTPYGIDALANHLAINGKATWVAELRSGAKRVRDALERYITQNDERTFLSLAIHKDKALEILARSRKDEDARRDLANLLVDLPLDLREISRAHPRDIIDFPQVLPPADQMMEGYEAQVRRFHLIYVGMFTKSVALMEGVRTEVNGQAKRLQDGYLYMVDKFADKVSHDERREALSDAGRGLVLASHKYDPDLGQITFKEYAAWCIRDAYQERTGSRSIAPNEDNPRIVRVERGETFFMPEYLVHLRKEGVISYKQLEILKLRYGLDNGGTYTIEEITAIFQTRPADIGRLEAEAIEALRERLPLDFPAEVRTCKKRMRDTA